MKGQNNLYQSTLRDPSGAYFSLYRTKRYVLWRIWDKTKPKIMWIGLNPSNANEKDNDPTIRRVIVFARDWGYGGIYMVNLIPLISSNPSLVDPAITDKVKEHNLAYIRFFASKCDRIIACWGNSKLVTKEMVDTTMNGLKNVHCLILNKDGSPRHPLYVPANTKPIVI